MSLSSLPEDGRRLLARTVRVDTEALRELAQSWELPNAGDSARPWSNWLQSQPDAGAATLRGGESALKIEKCSAHRQMRWRLESARSRSASSGTRANLRVPAFRAAPDRLARRAHQTRVLSSPSLGCGSSLVADLRTGRTGRLERHRRPWKARVLQLSRHYGRFDAAHATRSPALTTRGDSRANPSTTRSCDCVFAGLSAQWKVHLESLRRL